MVVKSASLLFFLILCAALHAQETLLQPGRIIFYNVENLFDTIDEPDKIDEEFTPASKANWNTCKYQEKLQHIAQVIDNLTNTIQPFIIGFAEVENKQVLIDLINQPSMKDINWGIIHFDSPDERGIDVAMLYNREVVKEAMSNYLRVDLGNDDNTRDIAYLKCYINEGEPLWVFANHWPSRRAATDSNGTKRTIAAKTLLNKIENLYLGEPFAHVIVMGDLNDNPADSSVQTLLNYKFARPEEQQLVDLMQPLKQAGKYSVTYREQKDVFDQIIVSQNLLNTRYPLYVRDLKAHIYSPTWLMYEHQKYGPIPNRTYSYGKYVGGYSDHLPVYIDIVFK